MPLSPTLSPRQAELVAVVERLTAQAGYPPSCREIAAVMGVHYSRAHQLIASAAARGAVARDPGKMRSVRVLHRPTR
jgi:SOS-response transcriptional repressor LexA